MRWNDSALNPVVTIQIFFVQILYGNTAIEHLKHLTGLAFTASAYCQARMRVSLESLHFLLERSVDQGFFCPRCLALDPLLEPLHADPRFVGVLESASERHLAFARRFGLEPDLPD